MAEHTIDNGHWIGHITDRVDRIDGDLYGDPAQDKEGLLAKIHKIDKRTEDMQRVQTASLWVQIPAATTMVLSALSLVLKFVFGL